MPTIYAATTDRDINSGNQSSWSNARDASTGTLGGSASDSSESFAVGSTAFAGRGSTTYKVYRSFFHFDTSALTDIKNNNDFKFAVVNFDYDYNDTAPSGSNYVGLRFANFSGTSSDPQIEYTVVTGYANDVMGVASANIGKVNGVATASVSKVIGV